MFMTVFMCLAFVIFESGQMTNICLQGHKNNQSYDFFLFIPRCKETLLSHKTKALKMENYNTIYTKIRVVDRDF